MVCRHSFMMVSGRRMAIMAAHDRNRLGNRAFSCLAQRVTGTSCSQSPAMKPFLLLLTALVLMLPSASCAAVNRDHAPAWQKQVEEGTQYASFPRPLESYPVTGGGIMETLKARATADPFNIAATAVFLLAILHTFAAGWFTKRAHRYEHEHEQKLRASGVRDREHPDGEPEVCFKSAVFHLLGEVEAIFGLWVLALAAVAVYYYSWDDFVLYIGKDRKFTEPVFVVVIMAIAASRPVMSFAEAAIAKAAALGKGTPAAWWLSVLIVAPVLGSFITEPAAMTIAALLLAKKFYRFHPPARLAYGTLGLLFVNISVGGTLTNFAAPPVLMVAGKWGWSTAFMLQHFGWNALLGITVASTLYYLFFRKDLRNLANNAPGHEESPSESSTWLERETPVPPWVTIVHLGFLAWTVFTAHYSAVLFVGGYLFFTAFTAATRHHQNPIALRGPILVGFFLAGLVVHGGCQSWWIAPVISSLNNHMLMAGATLLTAFNDNAAITYLAAQVQDLSLGAKHAVVAGAVIGGGLTVIANAPNPAGQNILAKYFKDGISPLGLLLGALIPTLVIGLCFFMFPSGINDAPPPAAPPTLEKTHTP